jgi:hypothetical protein
MQVILLLYVSIVVPIRAGFSIDTELFGPAFWVDAFVDAYFVVDIIANFRTAYYDTSSGHLIINPSKIARRYIRSWLIVDVLSCMPVVYIDLIVNGTETGSKAGTEVKLFKGLRLLRLAKMLRLARIKKSIERHDDAVGPLMQSFQLIGVLALMCFTAHLFACLWYFVGEDPQQLSTGEVIEYGWVQYLEVEWNAKIGRSANETAACVNWQARSDDYCVGLGARYTVAVYWAMTTLSTVGFGDIHARTTREMIFAVLVEIAGAISFGVLVSQSPTVSVACVQYCARNSN